MKIKNSKNLFYINVDPELVIRNMIFFVIFCLAVGISINYFLWPMIGMYKLQYIEEKKIKTVFLQVQKDFNSTQALLKNTKNANQKILDIMSYQSSMPGLKDNLKKYFKNVEIIKKSSQDDVQNQMITDVYFVRGEIQSVQTMNNFFTELKDTPMSIKILLPVIVKKANDVDKLILEFYMNVEKSSYKPKVSL
ncbi:hypothetical protein [Helicobacter sp. 11S03491-1]|uniref:hypothetical protein n=1 Tax=Helicobacter sp. 11S03491-1 TaxID=1476196 RepID=UPI000BA78C80|nr:hypothetical protein [Helicobacter sp. 11S03491-1]PAF41143.1 hypothetical protein BKH45_07895 [Helicobacter sp. 11S03491-1]